MCNQDWPWESALTTIISNSVKKSNQFIYWYVVLLNQPALRDLWETIEIARIVSVMTRSSPVATTAQYCAYTNRSACLEKTTLYISAHFPLISQGWLILTKNKTVNEIIWFIFSIKNHTVVLRTNQTNLVLCTYCLIFNKLVWILKVLNMYLLTPERITNNKQFLVISF